MTEYIEKTKLLEQIGEDSAGHEGWYGDEWVFMDTISNMPTIDIPDTSIEFETPREQLAFICGAILEKQKRKAETERKSTENGIQVIQRYKR